MFEVPGFSREDLDVTLESGVLTVTAQREMPSRDTAEGDDRRFRHLERRFGRFTRSFRLPDNALVDDLDATCENGVLTVTVPKGADARPRRIEIDSGQRRQIAESSA